MPTRVPRNQPTGTRKGRRTLCRPELIDHVVDLVAKGAHPSHAAIAAGIAPATLTDWMRRADNAAQAAGHDPDTEPLDLTDPWINDLHPDDKRYVEMTARVRQAEAQIAATCAERIATDKDWRAAAWWLEHRARDEYPRPGLEVSGPHGGPLVIASVREEVLALVGRYDPVTLLDVNLGTSDKDIPAKAEVSDKVPPSTNGAA